MTVWQLAGKLKSPLLLPCEKQLPSVRRQSRDEVGPFAEHVEEVEDGQDNVQVEGGEEQGEVLHGGVEVAGETVLDK